MIELAKHIEVLLLENDCVIIPGLGGFIAHNRAAVYSFEKSSFEPPMRTLGFNPQLVINDGLLVQSYMQTYNTDFPDATRKIEKTVNALKEQLYQEGHVELDRIGTARNVCGSNCVRTRGKADASALQLVARRYSGGCGGAVVFHIVYPGRKHLYR